MREQIDQLIAAALNAVNPYNAIQNHLRLDGDNLIISNRVINLVDKDIRCVTKLECFKSCMNSSTYA